MKTKLSKIIVIMICVLNFNNLQSQTSTFEKPVSFGLNFDVKYDAKLIQIMPEVDVAKLTEEDEANEKLGISYFRFGYEHKVNLTLENSGQWFDLPNGDRLWQLRIVCPNALSINLTYDKFWLPDGAKFFVYSNDKEQYIGAFTSENNQGTHEDIAGFATELIYSNSIILEYYLPAATQEKGVISLDNVVHSYREVFQNFNNNNKIGDSFQGLPPCRVGINCSAGQDWQVEKRAIALIMRGGASWGTGSLINNTNYDFKPLFLTAKHVIDNAIFNSSIAQVQFRWNFESPATNCNNNSLSGTIYTTTGAKKLSSNIVTDFELVELTDHPAKFPDYTPYYLGWDRTGNVSSDGVCIHHPAGYTKSISLYSTAPTNCTNCAILVDGGILYTMSNYWKVCWINTSNGASGMYDGSSGAALLNSNRKIIGQLWGKDPCSGSLPNCNTGQSRCSFFGKFHLSWIGGGTNTTRLSDWLHRRNTPAPNTLDGISHCRNITLNSPQIGNPKIVSCEIVNIQQGATVPSGNKLEVNAKEVNIFEFEVQAGAEFEIWINP